MSDNKKFGENKVVFESGGDELPEPIALKLLPIQDALSPLYFEALDSSCSSSRAVNSALCCKLKTRRDNVIIALRNYAKWKEVKPPKGLCMVLFM